MTVSPDELLVLLSQFAEAAFEDEGVVAPLFHAVTESDEQLVYMTPWSDGKSKARMLKELRKQFAEKHVVRYGVVSEVWLAGYDGPASSPMVMPRDRPDRQEAVVIATVAPPQVVVARRDIVRPWDGSKAHLGPLAFEGMEHFDGGTILELL